MNSVMQVLFTIPEFITTFANRVEEIYNASGVDAHSNFQVQMAKLGNGLLSGDYSKPPQNEEEDPISMVCIIISYFTYQPSQSLF